MRHAGKRSAILLLFGCVCAAATLPLSVRANANADDDDADDEHAPGWIEDGGFVILIIALMCMFWALAVICEEFFVPALNIMCEEWNIPDDVAGATLMAAGASSPEMFSSFIALFITHSELGVGTVVGSEIFNHLCICAGSVLYAKSGVLFLDWRVLVRECLFYFFALLLLIWALKGHVARAISHIGDTSQVDKKLTVHWYNALVLIIVYCCYALVCSFYKIIVARTCPAPVEEGEEATEQDQELVSAGDTLEEGHAAPAPEKEYRKTLAQNNALDDAVARPSTVDIVAEAAVRLTMPATAMIDTVTVERGSFQCYLYKKSRFYSKIRLNHRKWQLRYFILDDSGLRYCRSPETKTKHVRAVNIFNATAVKIWDEDRNIFKLLVKDHSSYYFQAPTQEIMFDMITRLEDAIERYSGLEDQEKQERWKSLKQLADNPEGEMDDDVESLLEPPEGGMFSLGVHYFLLPLKYMFYYTVPDVRYQSQRGKYGWAIGSCVAWLAVLSYVMVSCAETLGLVFGISSAIMGLTFSAVGTSFPNLVSSMLVARQGLGNMAVSNAFGSNVFNIFIALGLPWLAYILAVKNGKPYDDLEDNGIVLSTLILLSVLVIFWVWLALSGFKMSREMGFTFLFMYVCFLVWALGVQSLVY